MDRNYTVQTKILRPVADVFDAVVRSEILCHYFTDKTTGDLVEGTEVGWTWNHYEFTLPANVDQVIDNERIELTIDSAAALDQRGRLAHRCGWPQGLARQLRRLDAHGHVSESVARARHRPALICPRRLRCAIYLLTWGKTQGGIADDHTPCSTLRRRSRCHATTIARGFDQRTGVRPGFIAAAQRRLLPV
jgi:uncharacterized protein YndB with AHSA1/START domain